MNDFDVVVVGGGPVGWSAALACTQAKPALRIAVIDRSAPPTMPCDMIDTRVYTVTDDNLAWLAALGVQFDEARTADVETIRVFERSGVNALTVDSRDARRRRLAAVVEHDALTATIAARARVLGVDLIEGEANSTGILDNKRYVELAAGRLLNAKLIIVADGANSKTRGLLSVESLQRNYERVGVVAHFCVDTAHRGEARQWFLPDQSILALLPLPDIGARSAVSMVWSTTNARADSLRELPADALCAAVTEATGGRVHVSAAHTNIAVFPLKLARVADPVTERALIVGDAAHAVHPLAGQGVNLGFGDAKALAIALGDAERVNHDIGHSLLLAKFRRSRYAAVLAMQAATDGLARIYNLDTSYFANSPLARVFPENAPAAIGDFGMRVLGKLPAFRRFVSSAAN